ncbi:MAG: DUF1922 domain-containing protein [Methanotrichaceae archaeon]|nr:DUF1922 domain-containing protein [Methanotrichaceae archaeon]
MFLVFRCSGCGRHLYAPRGAKTRTCPCGKRLNLSKVQILATAESASAAGEMVRTFQLQGQATTGFARARLHPK